MDVTVLKEKDRDDNILYKIVRTSERDSTTSYWTKAEAESLFAQLERICYKGG